MYNIISFECPYCRRTTETDDWHSINEEPDDGDVIEHECEFCGEYFLLETHVEHLIDFTVKGKMEDE